MAVLGVIMLYASRQPARNGILALAVALLELIRGAGGDFLWLMRGWPASNYVPFMLLHLIIAAAGVWFLQQESVTTSTSD